jgi:hypothetical protein
MLTDFQSLTFPIASSPVQVLSSKTGGFEECSMVWYNNLLSLPFIAVLVLWRDEHNSLMSQEALNEW